MQWCGASFSDAFTSWVHIKALRVFVESVLRYGLPPNFHVAVLEYPKKNGKKLRQVLQGLYQHLDRNPGEAGGIEVGPRLQPPPRSAFRLPLASSCRVLISPPI